MLVSFCYLAVGLTGQRQGLAAGAEALDVGTEVEMRIPLSEEGYDSLKDSSLFSGKTSRDDVYVDVYERGSFRLANGSPPVKARFMSDGSGVHWQVAAVTRRDRLTHDGVLALLKESRKAKVPMDGNDDRAASEAAQAIVRDARSGKESSERTREAADVLRRNPKMNALVKTVAGGWPMGWVLPAGRSTKQRLSGKLDVKGVKVAIVLGRTVSTSADGDDVAAYEFEADVKGNLTQQARTVYEAVIDRLVQSGLEKSHVLPDDGQSDFAFMQDVYRGLLP